MADYKHGTMDITEKQKTFDGFVHMVARLAVAAILVLIFLALVDH